jgi:hypothetical protein
MLGNILVRVLKTVPRVRKVLTKIVKVLVNVIYALLENMLLVLETHSVVLVLLVLHQLITGKVVVENVTQVNLL